MSANCIAEKSTIGLIAESLKRPKKLRVFRTLPSELRRDMVKYSQTVGRRCDMLVRRRTRHQKTTTSVRLMRVYCGTR